MIWVLFTIFLYQNIGKRLLNRKIKNKRKWHNYFTTFGTKIGHPIVKSRDFLVLNHFFAHLCLHVGSASIMNFLHAVNWFVLQFQISLSFSSDKTSWIWSLHWALQSLTALSLKAHSWSSEISNSNSLPRQSYHESYYALPVAILHDRREQTVIISGCLVSAVKP